MTSPGDSPKVSVCPGAREHWQSHHSHSCDDKTCTLRDLSFCNDFAFPFPTSQTLQTGRGNHPDSSEDGWKSHLGWHITSKVGCGCFCGKNLGLSCALHKWLPDVLQVWWEGSGCASGQVGLNRDCPFSVLRGVHLCRMRMESCMFIQVLPEIVGELLTGNFLLVRM